MTLSHQELLRFRQGEPDAFAEVVRAEGGRVRAIAMRYFSSLFDQEEAVQEIWLRVHEQRESLDPQRLDSFTAWLGTLARRRCIDLLRRRGETLLHDPEQIDGLATDELQERDDPRHLAEQRELLAAVQTFKQKLKPGFARFFELYFEKQLDYAEIAKELSISKLRCRYLKKVLIGRARRHRPLLEALDRLPERGAADAS